jgi:hypothetical protein
MRQQYGFSATLARVRDWRILGEMNQIRDESVLLVDLGMAAFQTP